MVSNETIKSEATALENELFEIYKDLHQHPELGFKEIRTSSIIAEKLRALNLPVTTGWGCGTGVTAILDSGKPGKTIMLRADMDALPMPDLSGLPYASQYPNVCHACGHDAHTSMLLGAAKLLCRHKEDLVGKVMFLFDPCEEGNRDKELTKKIHADGYYGYLGKTIVAEDKHEIDEDGLHFDETSEIGIGGSGYLIHQGVLKNVDACFALHVSPGMPLGKVSICQKEAMASSDRLTITFQGKGGHGSEPENAVDPVPAMAEMLNAIYTFPTREIPGNETTVFNIGSISTPGSILTSIPDRAVIEMGYRCYSAVAGNRFRKRIPEIAKSIGKAWRCSVACHHGIAARPTINNVLLSEESAKACIELFGTDNVIYPASPKLAAESFGAYSDQIPGVYMMIGTGTEAFSLHNPRFHVASSVLPIGVSVFTSFALKFLSKHSTDEKGIIS